MSKRVTNILADCICQLTLYILPANSLCGNKYELIGDLCNYFNLPTLAIKYYQKAKKEKSESFSVIKKLVKQLHSQKLYLDSIAIFSNLNRKIYDFELIYLWAKSYERICKYDDAIKKHKETLQLNPFFIPSYFSWGNILDEQGNYEDAISKYTVALELEPENPQVSVALALAYEAIGEYDKAYRILSKTIIFNPKYVEAHFAIGTIQEKQGNYAKAINSYKKALALDPAYADVHIRWGEVLYLQGNYEEALEKYKTALKIDPENTWALYDLACAYVKIGRMSEGIKHIKKAISMDKTIIVEVLENKNLSPIIENPQLKGLCKI